MIHTVSSISYNSKAGDSGCASAALCGQKEGESVCMVFIRANAKKIVDMATALNEQPLSLCVLYPSKRNCYNENKQNGNYL